MKFALSREFLNKHHGVLFRYRDTPWVQKLLTEGYPPFIDEFFRTFYDRHSIHQYEFRIIYNEGFSFPLITQETVIELSNKLKNKKVLEVAAGSGYLSSLLRHGGVSIITTDNMSWSEEDEYAEYKNTFGEVEKIDAVEAIEKYKDEIDTVLLSWPPFNEKLALNVLEKCLQYGLDLIYIGEDECGCTADDSFFELCDEKCTREVFCQLAQFYGMHDYIYLIKEKNDEEVN